MRWLGLLALLAAPVLAQDTQPRLMRLDIDVLVDDPARVYETARDVLVAKHGLTESLAVEWLRPNGETRMQLCVELILMDRIGTEIGRAHV